MLIINVEIKDFYKIKGRVQCFVQVFGCGYLCKVETGKNLAIAFFFTRNLSFTAANDYI